MTRSVQRSIRIRAQPSVVWTAPVEPTKIARWMGDAHVESTWLPGSAMTFKGTFQGRPYRDRRTDLACEPKRVLRYNHWSILSRPADSEETLTDVSAVCEAHAELVPTYRVRRAHRLFAEYAPPADETVSGSFGNGCRHRCRRTADGGEHRGDATHRRYRGPAPIHGARCGRDARQRAWS